MKLIKELSEQMLEEIGDAEKYAKAALCYKDDCPDVAQLYYRLSEEEMDHMRRIHETAARIIHDYRAEHGEPPAAMQAVYDYLHEKQIDESAEVKRLQAMYVG